MAACGCINPPPPLSRMISWNWFPFWDGVDLQTTGVPHLRAKPVGTTIHMGLCIGLCTSNWCARSSWSVHYCDWTGWRLVGRGPAACWYIYIYIYIHVHITHTHIDLHMYVSSIRSQRMARWGSRVAALHWSPVLTTKLCDGLMSSVPQARTCSIRTPPKEERIRGVEHPAHMSKSLRGLRQRVQKTWNYSMRQESHTYFPECFLQSCCMAKANLPFCNCVIP